MPRGMFAEFIPSKSGVYRITSRTDSGNDVDGWIFDENRKELLAFENDERMFQDMENVSMVFYMEAGKKYYINIAFWDMYEVGNIYYDIEYVEGLSLWMDLKTLFFTVWKVVKRSDILVGSEIKAGRLDDARKAEKESAGIN